MEIKKIEFKRYNFSDDFFNDKILKMKEYHTVKYGKENNFPKTIEELYLNCPRHSSIVNSKTRFVQGVGFEVITEDMALKLKTEEFIKNVDLYNIYKQAVIDQEIYGGFGIGLIGNKLKDKYIPSNLKFSNIRATKMDDEENIEYYIYANNFKQFGGDKNFQVFKTFDEKNKITEKQILYVYRKNPISDYYPIPEYYPAINIINIDIQINNFHLNNIMNGMRPSMKVLVTGPTPTEEERKQITETLESEFVGSKNAGEYFLLFPEEGRTITIEPIQLNNSDSQFTQLLTMINDNIIKAHSIPPILSSEVQSGALSQRNEILTAYEFYYNFYIFPEQQYILDNFINKILILNGFAPVTVKKLELIKQEYSIRDLLLIYSQEEIKDIISKKINL